MCGDDGKRYGVCVCAPPPPPQPPPRPSLVPMNFLAYRGDHSYAVQIGAQGCVTPCALLLPHGPTSVHVTGSGTFDTQFVMPHLASQIRLQQDDSGAYVTTGAILVPSGIVVAASMWAVGLACGQSSGSECFATNVIFWPILGASMTTTGIVLLAVSGKHKAPFEANRPEILDANAAPSLRLTGVGLAPTQRGAVGGLGFAF